MNPRVHPGMDTQQLAEAFSSHRFEEVFPHLADDVRWVVPGSDPIEGRDAVEAACRQALDMFATQQGSEFTRFVSVGGETVAAVDAIGRYTDADGMVSVVSSADIYEFAGGKLTTITSYAVEV